MPGESPVLAQRAVSERWEGNSQTILLARRTRTITQCSSDARREGQPDCSPEGETGKIGRPSHGLMACVGVPVGLEGENIARGWGTHPGHQRTT